MFQLQLLQQQIKFTPYGLFDVDLGLFSMVSSGPARNRTFWITFSRLFSRQITGAVITYILILIQFDVAQKA
jgi:hypothetical protein